MRRPTTTPTLRGIGFLMLAVVFAQGCGESTPTDDDAPGSIRLSAALASFLGTEGGTDPEVQVLDVTSEGGTVGGLSASVTYGAGTDDWLATGLGGTTAPTTLSLTADASGVPAGIHEATVTVSGTGADPQTVTATLVLGPSGPPTIVITSPTRAAMLEEGTGDPFDVQVTGEACHDSAPITSLEVLGEEIPVSGANLCEPFDVVQNSAWGLSVVTVRAENAFGRAAEAVQSYLRSPSYLPAALVQDLAANVEHGVLAHLNQPAIDDGVRGTLGSPDADDLATLLELALVDFDANGAVPNPLSRTPSNAGAPAFHDCPVLGDRTNPATGVRVSHGTVTHARPSIDWMYGVDAGLDVGPSIWNIHVPLTVSAWFDGGCLLPNLSHTVTGSISASWGAVDATWQASLAAPGVAHVQAVDTVVSWSDLQVDVDWGALEYLGLGSLLDDALTDLVGAFEGALTDLLETVVANQVPPIAEEIIESFTLDQPDELNGAGTASVGLLDRIVTSGPRGSGHLELGLATQSWPAEAPTGPEPALGPIRAGGTVPSFDTAQPVGFALKDDVVNQFFWSAWQAGAFEIPDVSVYTGVEYPGIGGSVSALLPPVAMPGAGAYMLDVGLGDLAVSLTVDRTVFGFPGFLAGNPVTVEAFVSGVVGVDLALDDETYRLDVTNLESSLDVQLETDAPLNREALTDAVEAALADLLAELVPQAFAALTLPEIDSGDLEHLPQDYVIRVGNATVDRAGRYLRLVGDVVETR